MSFHIANLEKMSMPMSYDNKKTAAKLAAVFFVIEGWRLLLPYRSDRYTVIAGSVSNVPTVFFT